jgi:hypothetical protein
MGAPTARRVVELVTCVPKQVRKRLSREIESFLPKLGKAFFRILADLMLTCLFSGGYSLFWGEIKSTFLANFEKNARKLRVLVL